MKIFEYFQNTTSINTILGVGLIEKRIFGNYLFCLLIFLISILFPQKRG